MEAFRSCVRRSGRAWTSQLGRVSWLAQDSCPCHTAAAQQSSEEVPAPWKDTQWISTPVTFVEGQDPPTALSWLRRRGPPIPESLLQKLFNQRQIRVFNGEQIKRVRKTLTMDLGNRLLIPTTVIPEDLREGQPKKRKAQVVVVSQRDKMEDWVQQLTDSILYQDDEILAINKPPGLATQSGKGVKISVKDIVEYMANQQGQEVPRLVHRLDKDTSGVLVLAKTLNAASWLSEAFRTKKRKKDDIASRKEPKVRKTYWSVVQSSRLLNFQGKINRPVEVAQDLMLPAITYYWCKYTSDGLAFLKMRPITGRKHQIRYHCAFSLGSPILGDRVYAETRKQKRSDRILSTTGSGSDIMKGMHLHARELSIEGLSRKPYRFVAPPPAHMVALCKELNWPIGSRGIGVED